MLPVTLSMLMAVASGSERCRSKNSGTARHAGQGAAVGVCVVGCVRACEAPPAQVVPARSRVPPRPVAPLCANT
jgi:hypothetical protein